MLGKVWQRLVKESLIRVYTDSRTSFAKPFPVYYFACDGDLERVGLAVQSLHQIPQLPWPDDQCIILAEDVSMSHMTDEGRGLVCFVYSKNFKVLLNSPQESEIFYVGGTYLLGDRIISAPINLHYMQHVPQAEERKNNYTSYVDMQYSINSAIELLANACKRSGVKTHPEKYKQYLNEVLVKDPSKDSHWISFKSGDDKVAPGTAADLLAYLSNLAVPCHYMMRSKPNKGFGPTGEIQRLTRDKAIFTVIPYDRLYVELTKNQDGSEVSPHPRRGYIRHWWKRGTPPIDRFLLTNVSAIDRLILVHKNKVPRVYIHPTWVGNQAFQNEGFSFEMVTGETLLRSL